jgi:tRNA(Ile)-lysidine synthase
MPRPPKSDWPRIAEVLAVRIPRGVLHPAVVKWASGVGEEIRRPWAVALSGGADSLALLLLVWAHWPEHRESLVALHFDHRLRGRASTEDARFCERVCVALGVCFIGGVWAAARKGASEAEARAARFAFFQRTLTRRRIRTLWLGHQEDDIAETMLMRLARGSGSSGLSAPRPLQLMPAGRLHVRPLLTLNKVEIVSALREVGGCWREDASNETGDYYRNRIRREALPHWCAAAEDRDALAGAALSRELLEEDDAALEGWVDTIAPLSVDGRRLDVKVLHDKPRAVVRRALYRWLGAQADTGDLSRQGFATLLAAVENGRFTRFSLGRSGFAVIRKGVLVFEPCTSLSATRSSRK